MNNYGATVGSGWKVQHTFSQADEVQRQKERLDPQVQVVVDQMLEGTRKNRMEVELRVFYGLPLTDVLLDKYPKWPGFKEGLKNGTRDAVQSGSVPERDDSGEDRDAEHRDDPPASPDPEKGLDESPKAKTEGATVEWKLNRILAIVQERYGLGRVLHTILMSHEDVQQLLEEMDPSWHRESLGWRPAITWYFRPWNPRLQVDMTLKSGELKLCFHETHTT